MIRASLVVQHASNIQYTFPLHCPYQRKGVLSSPQNAGNVVLSELETQIRNYIYDKFLLHIF